MTGFGWNLATRPRIDEARGSAVRLDNKCACGGPAQCDGVTVQRGGGPMARPDHGPPLFSALHPHRLPWLVRFRRRLDGRHGHLRPVADLRRARRRRSADRRGLGHAQLLNRRPHQPGSTQRFFLPGRLLDPLQFAAEKDMPAWDLFWYDGGMKPRLPDGILAQGTSPWALRGSCSFASRGRSWPASTAKARNCSPKASWRRWRQASRRAQRGEKVRGGRTVNPWVAGRQRGPALAGVLPQRGIDHRHGEPRLRRPPGRDQGGVRQRGDEDHQRPRGEQYLVREYRKGWEL